VQVNIKNLIDEMGEDEFRCQTFENDKRLFHVGLALARAFDRAFDRQEEQIKKLWEGIRLIGGLTRDLARKDGMELDGSGGEAADEVLLQQELPRRQKQPDNTPFPEGVSPTVTGATAQAAASASDGGGGDDLTPNVAGSGAVNVSPIPGKGGGPNGAKGAAV
jgi:hypothetical protein